MKIAVAYAATITAASAVGASVATPPGPVMWDLGGFGVPVVPSVIAVLSSLLVRIIVITSPARRAQNLKAYNVAVTLLAMLGAAVYVTDNNLGPGSAFWTGVGCGALGVGIVELARSQMGSALRAGLRTMFAAMSGGGDNEKPPPPSA